MGAVDSAISYGNAILSLARSRQIPAGEAEGFFALAQAYSDIERVDSVSSLALKAGKICQTVGGCWFYNQLFALAAPLLPIDRDSLLFLLRAFASKAEADADTIGLARLSGAIGQIFEERFQQYDSARAYHRRVIQLRQPDRETVYGLARAFRGLGMPDSAWFYFTILLNVARQQGDLRSEGYALANMGSVCHRDLKPPRLGCALAYYDSAASVASQVLRQAGEDMNRVIYGEQASRIYQDWPLAWLSASDTIGQEAASLASLAVSELGRSEALRDLMGHFHTRDRLPLLGNNATGLGRQIVNMLPADGATLSYQIQADTIVAWLTLPTREVRVYRWAIPYDSLAARVSALRSTLGADDAITGSRLRGTPTGSLRTRHKDSQQLTRVSARLANALLPQDLEEVLPPGTDLVLLPQNVLNMLPFALLPLKDGVTLGERYSIRYSPSLVALLTVEAAEAAAPRRSAGGGALVVSDPAMPVAEIDGVRIRLSQLPAGNTEGAWIAARLGARWLSGNEATETVVLHEMTRADIIHFATHAFAYAYYSKVRDSFLALAPDSTHDGLLTVGKLMDDSTLLVPARLVVLSGCQTALGSVMQAEGTVGLQRAFLARGTRALLVSLWSVDDEATEMLMKSFYSHWLADADTPTKAEALRRAQQEMRHVARFADPLYWAAFELVGAN